MTRKIYLRGYLYSKVDIETSEKISKSTLQEKNVIFPNSMESRCHMKVTFPSPI